MNGSVGERGDGDEGGGEEGREGWVWYGEDLED